MFFKISSCTRKLKFPLHGRSPANTWIRLHRSRKSPFATISVRINQGLDHQGMSETLGERSGGIFWYPHGPKVSSHMVLTNSRGIKNSLQQRNLANTTLTWNYPLSGRWTDVMNLIPFWWSGQSLPYSNVWPESTGNSHTHPDCGPVGQLPSDLTGVVDRHSLHWVLPHARPLGLQGWRWCSEDHVLRGLRHLDNLQMITRWLQCLHHREKRKIDIVVIFLSWSNHVV